MTSHYSRASPGRDPLGRHLDGLSRALDGVGQRLRESIADAIGRTAADAIGEAIQAALSGPGGGAFPSRHYPSPDSQRLWGEPGGRPWDREEFRPGGGSYRDPFDEPDRLEEDFDEERNEGALSENNQGGPARAAALAT